MTFTDSINTIGDNLTTKWIPYHWRASADLIDDYRVEIRDAMLAGFSQSQFQRYQQPGPLGVVDQRRLAAVISGSRAFKGAIPRKFGSLIEDLTFAYYGAADAVYGLVSTAIAEAYDSNTPDGLKFTAKIPRETLSKLKELRYEGMAYGETVRLLCRDMPVMIRAQVNKAITQAGTGAVAQQMLLDWYQGAFDSFEAKMQVTFTQFQVWVRNEASRDMQEVIKL